MPRTNIVRLLTQEQKQGIYKDYSTEKYRTKTSLAKCYGISTRTLGRIIKEVEKKPVVEFDYTITKDQLTIFCNNESRSVLKGYPKFNTFKSQLFKEDFSDKVLSEVYDLLNLPTFLEQFSEGDITVDHKSGKVFYGTFEIKNSLTDHMMSKLNVGEDIRSFVKFADMLLKNPKKDIVEELYGFMKHNNMQINEDGYIISYKGVLENYNDCWTNTISNKIGCKPVVPRNKVEHDPTEGCGFGLHSGSLDYAKGWSRGHVMIVKTNPSDVCSVPWDCNSQKMRQCSYEIIGEFNG